MANVRQVEAVTHKHLVQVSNGKVVQNADDGVHVVGVGDGSAHRRSLSEV